MHGATKITMVRKNSIMPTRNHILTAVICGSVFLSSWTTHAITFTQSVSFVAQQSDAPESFTLDLEDSYRTIGGETFLKQSNLTINNLTPDSFIARVFLFDPTGDIGGGGRGGGSFVGPNYGPSAIPDSIEQAISPNYWFRSVVGYEVGPGGYCRWNADAGPDTPLIDLFNSGDLRVGIELADGHTYIAAAAVPDGGDTVFLFAAAIMVFAVAKPRWQLAPRSC